jgi:hypothetical protein
MVGVTGDPVLIDFGRRQVVFVNLNCRNFTWGQMVMDGYFTLLESAPCVMF